MNLKRETNFTGYFHCPLKDFSKALLPPASSLTWNILHFKEELLLCFLHPFAWHFRL